jgi:hypothetical protein
MRILFYFLFFTVSFTAFSQGISGKVFIDINGNAAVDINDKGQAAVRVELHRDVDNSGTVSAGDVLLGTQVTDASGNYNFIRGFAVTSRLNQNSDDAEQVAPAGAISTGSSDLELIRDAPDDQLVGLRFLNITIPNSTTIISAYIEFEIDEAVNTNPCNLTIRGQSADNPPTFSNANNISSRANTMAFVNWSPPNWTTIGQKQQTPNIGNIVQEIVNLGTWASGEAMVFKITGTGTRVAKAHDLGEANTAPLLVVNLAANYVVRVVTADLSPGFTLTSPVQVGVNNASFAAGTTVNFSYQGETTGCYAISDATDVLYLKNRFTGTEQLVGANGVDDIEAMAVDVFRNVIYAANGGTIGTINPVTGTFTALGAVGNIRGTFGTLAVNDVDGLTVNPFTTAIYGSLRRGGADVFFRINPTTGGVVPDNFGAGIDYVPLTGTGVGGDIDDFMIDPFTGIMYGANSDGGTFNSQLVIINYNTGATTVVGSFDGTGMNRNMDIEGIGSSDCGAIYATSGNSGSGTVNNRLYSVNKMTGAATVITSGVFSSGGDFEASDCLFAPFNRLGGYTFSDLNNNGVENVGEPRQGGFTVQLYRDINNNNAVDGGDELLQTVVSDAMGNFTFPVSGVVGNFVMRVSAPPTGYTLTTPNAQQVDYAACTLGQDFFSNKFGAYIVVLPVSFITVKATNIDKNVEVFWETAWEKDNHKYVVEKSKNGHNFEAFHTLQPTHHTSIGRQAYKVIDYAPFAKYSFYRIKQIDLDGTVTYSKIVVAQNDNEVTSQQPTIYPNPTKLGDKITINLTDILKNETVITQVAIFNTLGQEVYLSQQNKTHFEIVTNSNQWKTGLYLVKITTDTQSYVAKMIIE